MNEQIEMVRTFHRRIGAPVERSPRLLAGSSAVAQHFAESLAGLASKAREVKEPLFIRLGLCLEELSEWLWAHAGGELAEAADAIADRLFVLLGDAVESGLPLPDLFQAVAESNLSKTANVTSKDGKGVKGNDFISPRDQIAKIIAEALKGEME